MTSPPLLEVRAMRDAGFQLRARAIHALAGDKEARKTTLIKILADRRPQAAGSIRIGFVNLRRRRIFSTISRAQFYTRLFKNNRTRANDPPPRTRRHAWKRSHPQTGTEIFLNFLLTLFWSKRRKRLWDKNAKGM